MWISLGSMEGSFNVSFQHDFSVSFRSACDLTSCVCDATCLYKEVGRDSISHDWL